MKSFVLYLILLLSCLAACIGCKPEYDTVDVRPYPLDTSQVAVLKGLGDIETLIVSEWATATALLQTAVTTLQQTPTAVNLEAARQAWRNARNPWERNESFAFGPVGTQGIDAASDDWPLDEATLTQIISTTSITLNNSYSTQMATSTKGFHAIEFLLFGETGTKTVSDFKPREWQLLSLLTTDLSSQATQLKTRWTPGASTSFYDTFITAGQTGSTYAKTSDALNEVLGSMVDITNELPNSKMEKPLSNQSSLYAESRFADYSLTDYRNNLYGVSLAYLGQYETITASQSVSSLVAAGQPAIDDRVKTQLKLCLALIDLIPPTTFNAAITTKTAQLRDLQQEIRKLNQMLDQDVRAVLGL